MLSLTSKVKTLLESGTIETGPHIFKGFKVEVRTGFRYVLGLGAYLKLELDNVVYLKVPTKSEIRGRC